jgi:two-component system, OmpR family, response regulator
MQVVVTLNMRRSLGRRAGVADFMRLLIVEDDEMLAGALARGLAAEGYAVDVARDGVDGLHRAREVDYDAMILDILLPGLNGFKVCEALRREGRRLPILMLTAKDGELDHAEGLDTGADDYLVKPFPYVVLLARLRALLRRGPARIAAVLQRGPLRLDPASHDCWRGPEVLDLTPREFALLRYLMSRPVHAVVTRQELLEHVWGEPHAGDHNVVEVFVGTLRRKIDRAGTTSLIETVRGVGYRLRDDPT